MTERANAERPVRAFLYTDQLAELTPWSADRIRHMVADGTFTEGVHYFRPRGKRPVFSWGAIVEYIKGGPNTQAVRQDDATEVLDEETRQARALLG